MESVTVNIDGSTTAPEQTTPATKADEGVARAIGLVGFSTAAIAVNAALYRTPSGIFAHHELAYYVTAAVMAIAGVAEVLAFVVIWLSGDPKSHRALARALLLGSVVLLVVIAGLDGVGFSFGMK